MSVAPKLQFARQSEKGTSPKTRQGKLSDSPAGFGIQRWLGKSLWNRIAGVCLDYGHIGCVDRAIGIHVVAEIRLIDGCTLLCFCLRDVSGIHGAISVCITSEY